MRTLALCLFLLITVPLSAQQNLQNLVGSRHNSVYQYAYKISEKEAFTLFRSGIKKVNESYLHTLADSSLTDSLKHPSLPNGNYLIVQAKENRLLYTLETVSDLYYKLVNNSRDLVIALHDKNGQMVRNAKVYLNKKPIPYDPVTQTFRLSKNKKKGNVFIHYNGVVHYCSLKEYASYSSRHRNLWFRISNKPPLKYVVQPIRNRQYQRRRHQGYFYGVSAYEKNFRGFMVFNKPMYKPADTVRLKAYVMNKKGNGLNKKLLLRLSDQHLTIDTIIAVIAPYRDGGYEYSFVLSDSLDLDLDDNYLLTLEEERSRKYNLDEYDGDMDEEEYALKRNIVMRGKFRYEEYELKSTTFTVRSDKTRHTKGEPLSIYAKATDENDLPVLDGRVKTTVTVNSSSFDSSNVPHLFLPDTLWQFTQPLETVGETKITLPDSIFPAASFLYTVQCSFLNASNESEDRHLFPYFTDNRYNIKLEAKKDSLFIDYLLSGKSTKGMATLYAFNQLKDTLLVQQLSLPALIPLHPFASSYMAKTDSAAESFFMSKANAGVQASSVRTRDSIMVQLINPYRLPVWYTIFSGQKVVQRGYGDSLLYLDKVRTPKNYFLSLQYIYGDKVHNVDYTIPYLEKWLKIDVKQPQFVYPGQTSNITIAVTNVDGKPVADADVTAYAFTRKFEGNSWPSVPYMGKLYPLRKGYKNLYIEPNKNFNHEGRLNWERWSREMGLDSIEYFKFLHPANIYRSQLPAKDSITQLAPFVVLNGELQPVHHIYIDERPVFFSQSQHLQQYSFRLSEGKHSLKLRTHKLLITLDSLIVIKGMKTFLSINADTSNKMVRLQPMPDTLLAHEKFLWNKYTLVIENNFGNHMTTIQQDDNVFMLNYNDSMKAYTYVPVLVGPLSYRAALLKVKSGFEQTFDAESGYIYNISKGLIKQKQLSYPYAFNTKLSNRPARYNFSDFVLTAKEVDSLWLDYLDHRCAHEDLFRNPDLNRMDNGRLKISVNNDSLGKTVFVKNIFLFRYDQPDFVRVYKGATRDLGYLQPGNYRMLLLLKADEYFIVDSINVQKNGLNYHATGIMIPKTKDRVSTAIAAIVNNRTTSGIYYNSGDLDSIKTTFNNQYLDTSSFTGSIFGQVKDKDGKPIAGASVIIKGTRMSTLTDALGKFSLKVPEKGTLIVTSIGYRAVENRMSEKRFYEITLLSVKNELSEVVVTGYGTRKMTSVTGSVSSVTTQALQGSLAGVAISQGNGGSGTNIRIRGAAAVSSAASPLIIIDGVPFSGSMTDLDPAQIATTNVLSSAAATAIYGSMGANGVLLITTKKAKETAAASSEEQVMASAASLRRNFRDDAYWQPKLRTDKEGKTSFTVTFPDDITNWQTHVAAVAAGRHTGYAGGSIISFKALSANLGLPQFAVDGDTIHVIGKTLNYMPDSTSVKRTFSFNGTVVKENRISLRNSWIDTFPVRATKVDSLAFKYTVQKTDGYFDGEERKVPVFKQGVLETKGFFATLENDTSFTITTDSSLGTVKVFAESSLLPVLETEIGSIRNYEYLCNEQLASKLKALLLQKRLCSHMKKDFDGDKHIREIISKLNGNKSQNLWGWWTNTSPLPWISLHVVEAMLKAEQAGYKTTLNKQVIIDYLVYNLESYQGYNKLLTLQLLHALDGKIDYNRHLDTIQKQQRTAALHGHLSMYDQLRWLEIKQKTGAKISLDTLVPKARKTMFGNLYWGEENRNFFDNSIQITLIMYRLMKGAGGYEAALKKVRNYFLEKRRAGNWRNTYESSLILETILPDLLMKDQALQLASLTVTGTKTATVQTFPFAAEINGGQKITVTKKGSQPVYFTTYQQQWNATPLKMNGDFSVTSSFEKNDRPVTTLKAGEQVLLKVKVEVRADADYIMIEIPIPAGCSYANKSQSFWNNEVHREYFKNKVSIFCSTLKKGTYTFTVSLMPRYNGVYHLNPAKTELMYFPTFFGREEMKKVNVY